MEGRDAPDGHICVNLRERVSPLTGLIVNGLQVPRADARGYVVSTLPASPTGYAEARRVSGATEWRHNLAPPVRAGFIIETNHEPRRGDTKL